jgi:hypothetical protein
MLASGDYDKVITVLSPATGEVLEHLATLPGDEWLSYSPGSALYVASHQGADYASIRFDNQLRPVYPLQYYHSEMRRDDLHKAMSIPPPLIKPKPIRYAWDNLHNKGLWFGAAGLLYFTAFTVTLVVFHRSDPTQIARRFFTKAGFQVDSESQGTVLLSSKAGVPATAVFSSAGITDMPNRPGGKTYVIYTAKESPSSMGLQTLRKESQSTVIPLLYSTLARAVDENVCEQRLRELEEPFTVRNDPYDESRPIVDPTWFYGRSELLERLPAVLRQGQHAGLFGLRKVGKTSLINQLRGRLTLTPTVWIDCQGYPPVAEELFHAILEQVRMELRLRKIRKLPPPTANGSRREFRKEFLGLYEAWLKSGGHGPFILILDEADKLFPDRRISNSERILGEWVSLFRVLRALAQERNCISVLVSAYRPDLNRQNLISPSVGENPMFMSFQEHFLGQLDKNDTEAMVREIGAWKDIHWSPDALDSVYELCGGHPLVARLLASDACEQGDRKEIDLARLAETACTIRTEFHKHRIGRYYKESIWDFLRQDERQALELVLGDGFHRRANEFSDCVANLEHFGLVRSQNCAYEVSAQLFRDWLARG